MARRVSVPHLVEFVIAFAAWATVEPVIDDEPVVPVRQDTQVLFYGLKGEPDLERLNEALEKLGATLVSGPFASLSRPDFRCIGVEAPADMAPKDVVKAVKKGKAKKVEPLAWAAFEDRDNAGTSLPNLGRGLGERDHILGMSGDLRWFDESGSFTQFYYLAGKIEAEEIIEKYGKLYGGFGGGTLGRVVEERVHWKLTRTVDERLGKRLAKAIGKLDGVRDVHIAARRLDVTVALGDLTSSGPVRPLGTPAADTDGVGPVRASYPSNALYDLLLAEGLLEADA